MAVVVGTNGDDDLFAGPDGDTVLGLEGNDKIHSGPNLPGEFHGGLGDDSYYLSKADTIVENVGEGIDKVYLNTGKQDYALPANVENLIVEDDVAHLLLGNALDNRIIAGSGNRVDTIRASAGNNYYDGGPGIDSVVYTNVGASGGISVDATTGIVSNNGFGGAIRSST